MIVNFPTKIVKFSCKKTKVQKKLIIIDNKNSLSIVSKELVIDYNRNIWHPYICAVVNPALQQSFIVARCLKFFPWSTEHTILQNALILPHIDGLTSNLVCWWRGLSNNFPNFYNDCATGLDFWGTVSKLMGHTVYTH